MMFRLPELPPNTACYDCCRPSGLGLTNFRLYCHVVPPNKFVVAAIRFYYAAKRLLRKSYSQIYTVQSHAPVHFGSKTPYNFLAILNFTGCSSNDLPPPLSGRSGLFNFLNFKHISWYSFASFSRNFATPTLP